MALGRGEEIKITPTLRRTTATQVTQLVGEKMLNLSAGIIEIAKLEINPKTSKDLFLSSILKDKVIEKRDVSKGDGVYSRYELGRQKIDNDIFYVSLFFDNEKIEILSISLVIDDDTPSWSTWSEEREILRKELNNKWLYKYLGYPPYKYDWGEISSYYDSKGGFSYITIKYH